MHYKRTRKFSSYLHMVIAGYQLVYIYTPLHNWHYALPIVQWITFPLLFASGLWLWRGKKLWNWGKHRMKKLKRRNTYLPSFPEFASANSRGIHT